MTTKKFTPIIKRGPRLTPGEINVKPPEDLGIEIPPSGLQKALPWVMGGGMLGMIVIMIFTGIRQLSPYMLMMPLMMIMATVGLNGRRRIRAANSVPEINADRKEYLRYLSGSADPRYDVGRPHRSPSSTTTRPIPMTCCRSSAPTGSGRAPPNVDFYAATRIGLGAEPAVDRLLKPSVGGELAGPQGAPAAAPRAGQSHVGDQVPAHARFDPRLPETCSAAHVSDDRRRRRPGRRRRAC